MNTEKVSVFAVTGKDENELTKQINLFGSKNDVIATQIFQKTNSWVAFCYYKDKANPTSEKLIVSKSMERKIENLIVRVLTTSKYNYEQRTSYEMWGQIISDLKELKK